LPNASVWVDHAIGSLADGLTDCFMVLLTVLGTLTVKQQATSHKPRGFILEIQGPLGSCRVHIAHLVARVPVQVRTTTGISEHINQRLFLQWPLSLHGSDPLTREDFGAPVAGEESAHIAHSVFTKKHIHPNSAGVIPTASSAAAPY
jgi:hypothetical protein